MLAPTDGAGVSCGMKQTPTANKLSDPTLRTGCYLVLSKVSKFGILDVI